jgi:hypothetical protein
MGTRISLADGGGIEAQVGVADGFLHLAHHVLFPGLHTQGMGIHHGDIGDLADQGRGTVVVHLDVVQDAGVGAAGANLAEIGAQGLDGFLHLVLGGLLDVGDHLCLLISGTVAKGATAPRGCLPARP